MTKDSLGSLVFLEDTKEVCVIYSRNAASVTLKTPDDKKKVISREEFSIIPKSHIIEHGEERYYNGSMWYLTFSGSYPQHITVYVRSIYDCKLWSLDQLVEYFSSIKPMTKNKINSLIKEARKKLKEKAPATACASYAVISDNGLAMNASDICHARMGKGNTIHAVVDIHNKWKNVIPSEDQKAYKEVVGFVIRDSAWKNAFLSNNPSTFLAHGVVLDTSKPVSYVFQAVVALRMARERRDRLTVWKALRKANIKPEACYVMMLSHKGDGKDFKVSCPMTHNSLGSEYSLKKLGKFFKGDMSLFEKDKSLKDSGNWRVDVKFEGYGEDTITGFLNKRYLHPDNQKGVKVNKNWGSTSILISKNTLIKVAKEVEDLLEKA